MIPPLTFRIKASIVMSRQADLEVLQILKLVRMCQATNSLPLQGGLLDQDSYFVFLFMLVYEADVERQRIEQARQKVR